MRATVLCVNQKKFYQKICIGAWIIIVMYTFFDYKKFAPAELAEKIPFRWAIVPTHTDKVILLATVLYANRNKFCQKICTGTLIIIVVFPFSDLKKFAPEVTEEKKSFLHNIVPVHTDC